MPRQAKDGLSRHPTKGYRLQLGKTSAGKYRTFWLGQNRAVADYHAHNLKGQFEHMRRANRDVWTEEDLAGTPSGGGHLQGDDRVRAGQPHP